MCEAGEHRKVCQGCGRVKEKTNYRRWCQRAKVDTHTFGECYSGIEEVHIEDVVECSPCKSLRKKAEGKQRAG